MMQLEETNSDTGAMVFAIIGSMIIGLVLLVPSLIGYAVLWLGGKFDLWVFDTEKEK
jgi:hypothetical protein